MQLNPARGRKQVDGHFLLVVCVRFMQLNPARGRKRIVRLLMVAGYQPWFMQLNPARGRKLVNDKDVIETVTDLWFMQLNPARGRKQA